MTQTGTTNTLNPGNGDLVIMSAEVRKDTGRGGAWARKGITKEELHAHDYRPTTLVMVFPPGELAELRRLIWGES